MSRLERRRELQLTRRLVGVKAVLAVRLPRHPPVYSAHGFLVESHLQTQRAAIKMLHDRILVLVSYVKDVLSGMFYSPPPHATLILFPS
jgi:plasmid replication initiation protein